MTPQYKGHDLSALNYALAHSDANQQHLSDVFSPERGPLSGHRGAESHCKNLSARVM